MENVPRELDTRELLHPFRAMFPLKSTLGRLRVIGWWEGVSFLLLLGIAMPLKYFADSPGAVRVVGMAHGVLFVLYVLAAIHAALEHNWSWRRLGLVLLGSVLPGGPFVVDARILVEEETRLRLAVQANR